MRQRCLTLLDLLIYDEVVTRPSVAFLLHEKRQIGREADLDARSVPAGQGAKGDGLCQKRSLDARRPCLALLRSARWASHPSILRNGHFPYKSMTYAVRYRFIFRWGESPQSPANDPSIQRAWCEDGSPSDCLSPEYDPVAVEDASLERCMDDQAYLPVRYEIKGA